MTNVPLKVWQFDEASRHGVHPETVAEWRRAGHYRHLRFKRRNSRVITVSGEDIRVAPPLRRGKRIQFERADWSMCNADIARKLKCDLSSVIYWRRKLNK